MLRVNADTWRSPATGGELRVELLPPVSAGSESEVRPLVIYLKNLAVPRVGMEPDESILRDLRADGLAVAVIDYAGHAAAALPGLKEDLLRLREDLRDKRWLADVPVDLARVYIVPAGCRLRRDVEFYREAGRVLALDVVYPSRPTRPAGAVLEFTCDNAARMGNFSLIYCTDILLPLAALDGHAAAMADHPVAAPYKGLDPMPESAWKAHAAVAVLRSLSPGLGLNGRVVTAGFSRGSGMALLCATYPPGEPGPGAVHTEVLPEVSGAVVMSGRFTYLDLLPADRMLPRYASAWGARELHEATWREHGALDYLRAPAVPLFLTINVTEAPDALHQMQVLRNRLDELASPYVYRPETEPRGHKMPLADAVLAPLRDYLRERLNGDQP